MKYVHLIAPTVMCMYTALLTYDGMFNQQESAALIGISSYLFFYVLSKIHDDTENNKLMIRMAYELERLHDRLNEIEKSKEGP